MSYLPWPSPQQSIMRLNFPFPSSTRFLVYLEHKYKTQTEVWVRTKVVLTHSIIGSIYRVCDCLLNDDHGNILGCVSTHEFWLEQRTSTAFVHWNLGNWIIWYSHKLISDYSNTVHAKHLAQIQMPRSDIHIIECKAH